MNKIKISKLVSVEIKYCVPCGYLPRAQEFKKALEEEGASVELIDGDRGVFDVWVNDNLVFSKHKAGRFPSIEEITQKL